MQPFLSKNLINYTIGKNAYNNIESVCKELGKNALIIGGKTALEKAANKLISKLNAFNIVDTCIYGKECCDTIINGIVSKYKDSNIDFIIAVGGGKAIDTCKCVAEILSLPFITIPTLASNCAACSSLSVMYNEEHQFTELRQHLYPAKHCFIDTEIILSSPIEYFQAGIGDTFAKYYEVEFSMRGKILSFEDSLGKSISSLSKEPLLDYAEDAYNDFSNQIDSEKLQTVIMIIIISTGLVSMLIKEDYNGAVAHSLFYALTSIQGFEENNRHGNVVAYGVLVQLILDKQIEEATRIYKILSKLKVKTSLNEMGVKISKNELFQIIELALKDPDMKIIPYTITKEMIYDAILDAEKLKQKEQY